MIRVSPSMGQMLDMNILLRHLLFLLEYCMVTGYDWWDVLLHVQPGMVHNLVEKLHEEYMRQNQALQQVRLKPLLDHGVGKYVKSFICLSSTLFSFSRYRVVGSRFNHLSLCLTCQHIQNFI